MLEDDNASSMEDNHGSPTEQGSSGRYTRDMGLWNTCRESRDVITAHYHLDLWRLAQNRSSDSDMRRTVRATRTKYARSITSNDNDFFTVAFGPFDNDSALQPTYHRLVIRTSSPESLLTRLDKLNLYLPWVKGPRHIILSRKWKLALDMDRSFHDIYHENGVKVLRYDWDRMVARRSQCTLWLRCWSGILDGKIKISEEDCPFILFDRSGKYSFLLFDRSGRSTDLAHLLRGKGQSFLLLEDDCYVKVHSTAGFLAAMFSHILPACWDRATRHAGSRYALESLPWPESPFYLQCRAQDRGMWNSTDMREAIQNGGDDWESSWSSLLEGTTE
jgi:hypothetical protein